MAMHGGGNQVMRMNGDWLCPSCGDLQFGRNLVCRICGTPQPHFNQGFNGAMPVYMDYSNGGYGMNGGFNGNNAGFYGQSSGSTNFNTYPQWQSGKGFSSKPSKGSRFPNGKGTFNNFSQNGSHGGRGFGGKGQRGSLQSHSNPQDATQAASSSNASELEGSEKAQSAPTNGAKATNGEDVEESQTQVQSGTSDSKDDKDSGDAGDSGEKLTTGVVMESLECPHHLAGAIIGRNGSAIAQLRHETRCHIEIEASLGNGAPRTVTVSGPPAAVQEAIGRIRKTLEERLAATTQNGEGAFGTGHHVTEEDRENTNNMISSLENAGLLQRSWLDERCMEVLMLLPFDITRKVFQEAIRVNLWKTRNVSAFLMMLVKNVQHGPSRGEIGEQRSYRSYQNGKASWPNGKDGHGMGWNQHEGANMYYGASPDGYVAAPWMQEGSIQAFTVYDGHEAAYEQDYMNGVQAQGLVAASGTPVQGFLQAQTPGTPVQQCYAAPTFAVVGNSWSPSNSPQGVSAVPMAVPMSPIMNGSPGMVPIVMVPASPQMMCVQMPSDSTFELPAAAASKYGENAEGIQTPELGSDPGDVLQESFLAMPFQTEPT